MQLKNVTVNFASTYGGSTDMFRKNAIRDISLRNASKVVAASIYDSVRNESKDKRCFC